MAEDRPMHELYPYAYPSPEELRERKRRRTDPTTAERLKWAKRNLKPGYEGFVDPGAKGKALIGEYRREAAFQGIMTQATAWKDNRWFRQAFEEAYKKPGSKIQKAYMRDVIDPGDPGGGEGGHVTDPSWGGYGGFYRDEQNKWAHQLAARANEIFTEYTDKMQQRQTEEKLMAQKTARGGTGRGSILTTAQGVETEAEIRKKTLVGA